MISAYSILIYTCLYKKLNYTKCVCNNRTAVHILGHEDEDLLFLRKGKIRLKKSENLQKHTKNKEVFHYF